MKKPWKLSVHDVVPVGPEMSAGEAIRGSLDLVRRAEELGYTRYWFAEHHNSLTLACSQPALLIAQAAALTSTIRLGSGGVMLPNHSSLTVAEQFRTLEALYPGRIDLGLGRAPGTDGRTAIALRRSAHSLGADDFPQQLRELIEYFDRGAAANGILAVPVQAGSPELWMLGSSEGGVGFASKFGLPFAFASHLNPDGAIPLLRAYRAHFKPSAYQQEPSSIFSCSVICAETFEETETLAAIVDLQWLRIATGIFNLPSPTAEEALAYRYSPTEESIRRSNRARHIIGVPSDVKRLLIQHAEAAQADEIMMLALIHDPAKRTRLYELLAGEFEIRA